MLRLHNAQGGDDLLARPLLEDDLSVRRDRRPLGREHDLEARGGKAVRLPAVGRGARMIFLRPLEHRRIERTHVVQPPTSVPANRAVTTAMAATLRSM